VTGVSDPVLVLHCSNNSRKTSLHSTSIVTLNVSKKLQFTGNSNTNPQSNAKPSATKKSPVEKLGLSVATSVTKASPVKSPWKTMTSKLQSSIGTSVTKVSPVKSPTKTKLSQTNNTGVHTEIKFKEEQLPISTKLHAYKIDWINSNIMTNEVMKYGQ
jgi:hypothetical protein